MPPATHAVTRGKNVMHVDNDMISVGVEGGQFSVGMDCPKSFFGGTNSVRVVPWYDPSGVAKRAMDSHT
ncbi:hypothetical protein HCH54_008261 [Aspergillus fumigatus]